MTKTPTTPPTPALTQLTEEIRVEFNKLDDHDKYHIGDNGWLVATILRVAKFASDAVMSEEDVPHRDYVDEDFFSKGYNAARAASLAKQKKLLGL